jgi:hypothetical protein
MQQRRFQLVVLLAGATMLVSTGTGWAQQTLNLQLGGFAPKGEDARVDGDILNQEREVLAFDIRDFNGPVVGAEWLVPIGGFFEAGAGVSFTRRTVPSVYERFVDVDGSEIEQDLRLRTVPVAFTLRALPLGQSSPVQPYLGAGLAVIGWRYSESGEFVDFQRRNEIFRDRYVASGSETGPVVLAGLRFVGDTMSAGGEVRYQSAAADLGAPFDSFARDPRIDLGGWSYLFTVGLRFGR